MRKKYNEFIGQGTNQARLTSNNSSRIITEIASNIGKSSRLTTYFNRRIDEEAKRINRDRPKTKIASAAITLEGEKMQLLLELSKIIKENPDKYQIIQPSLVVKQLIELGLLESDAADTVITNLITGKRFEIARKTINNFMHLTSNINHWQNAIEKAELADIVLKGITESRTAADDDAYFAYMKSEIDRRNIKHTDITLGKAHDGRIITLADVWSDSQNRIGSSRS